MMVTRHYSNIEHENFRDDHHAGEVDSRRFQAMGSGPTNLRPPGWAWTPRSGAIAPCVGRGLKKIKKLCNN
jgi:hypothetical protein